MDVRTLCLGVLQRGDASGYEIKKEFESGAFSHFCEASFGSIYPALTRLTDEGLVRCTALPQDKRPDKKIYAITGPGKRALVDAIRRDPGPDRYRSSLMFILFFAENLPPETLWRLVQERADWYRDRLADLDLAEADVPPHGPGHAFVRGFARAVYGAAADYLDANRDTLVETVAERDDAPTPDASPPSRTSTPAAD